MIRTLALILLAGPAWAQDPYAPFVASVEPCLARADDAATARACIGIGAHACMETAPDGQTTVGMMFCQLAERDVWERLLAVELTAAQQRAVLSDDAERPYHPEFAQRTAQLDDSQRAWLAYRGAQCAMEYGAWGAGSMRQIAGADCQLRLTAARVVDLTLYLAD